MIVGCNVGFKVFNLVGTKPNYRYPYEIFCNYLIFYEKKEIATEIVRRVPDENHKIFISDKKMKIYEKTLEIVRKNA